MSQCWSHTGGNPSPVHLNYSSYFPTFLIISLSPSSFINNKVVLYLWIPTSNLICVSNSKAHQQAPSSPSYPKETEDCDPIDNGLRADIPGGNSRSSWLSVSKDNQESHPGQLVKIPNLQTSQKYLWYHCAQVSPILAFCRALTNLCFICVLITGGQFFLFLNCVLHKPPENEAGRYSHLTIFLWKLPSNVPSPFTSAH